MSFNADSPAGVQVDPPDLRFSGWKKLSTVWLPGDVSNYLSGANHCYLRNSGVQTSVEKLQPSLRLQGSQLAGWSVASPECRCASS